MCEAYLNRIGYTGDLAPTAENLRALQRAHLHAVPFENLDIAWGRQIQLERAALHDKIVTHQRGGFCYELNGLFATLLEDLGYMVTRLSAQVARGDGGFGPPFDHLALRVLCPADPLPDDAWLVDVGFGDTFREPLSLLPDVKHREGARLYWLEALDDGLLLQRRDEDGTVKRQYRFSLDGHDLADFAPMCHVQQTSPDSHFTQQRMITLALPNGRITLRDNHMIRTEGSEQTITEFPEAEFPTLLQTHFNITVPA